VDDNNGVLWCLKKFYKIHGNVFKWILDENIQDYQIKEVKTLWLIKNL
jgi:hypothetical protein